MDQPNGVGRRQVLKWAAAGLAASSELSLASIALAATEKSPTADWSQRVIDSNLKRIPDPKKFGGWGYPQGLFLISQYLIYRRTKDRKLLEYIIAWMNVHVDASGNLSQPIESLDNVLA